MKQLLLIHGGAEYASIDDLNADLQEWEVKLEAKKKWKDWLAEELSESWQVLRPEMPCKLNARYSTWKIWFEKYLEKLDFAEKVVLLGHSLGALFLVKYMAENQLPGKAAGLFLVSPVLDNQGVGGREKLDSFLFEMAKAERLSDGVEKIVIFHSEDDPVVPIDHAERLQQAIPGSELMRFQDRGHFSGPDFVELLEAIGRY